MLEPRPDLPDNTSVDDVDLPTRIRNVFSYQRIKTIGEVRELPDSHLLSFYDLGAKSVSYLRLKLGGPRPLAA